MFYGAPICEARVTIRILISLCREEFVYIQCVRFFFSVSNDMTDLFISARARPLLAIYFFFMLFVILIMENFCFSDFHDGQEGGSKRGSGRANERLQQHVSDVLVNINCGAKKILTRIIANRVVCINMSIAHRDIYMQTKFVIQTR